MTFYFQHYIDTTNQWYLSKNGYDSPQCGTTYKEACKTFSHLLTVIYNGAADQEDHQLPNFEIDTVKSITLTQKNLVSFL